MINRSLPTPSPPSEDVSSSSPAFSDTAQCTGSTTPKDQKSAPYAYICDEPGCSEVICGSKRTKSRSNLHRHKRTAHPEKNGPYREFQCERASCKARYRGARAKENLRTHMRTKHGVVFERKDRRE